MTVAGTSGTGSQAQSQSAIAGQGEGFAQDIGLDQAALDYPYRGSGYSVAIIDTGIDYNNPALGGGWGKRVIAGYNFVNNTSDPMDDNGHGTHVAGIIGSSNPTYTGVAPDVDFVALKVLDASGSGTFGAVDEALQWVAAHQVQYHIVAVNMSLGSGNYTIDPFTYLESDFTALKNEGVFIACASGNNFYGVSSQQGLAYPAISPQVVSVGAVWDGNFGAVSWVSGARDNTTAADDIASFTQRSAGLDILAPGAMITSTYLNDTFVQMAGTSMATPVVAGAAVLMHEALDAHGESSLANQDYILNVMQTTGVTIVDNKAAADNVVNTGLSFKRLNLFAALNAIGPVNQTPPTLAAIPNQTMTAGVSLVITLSAAATYGGPLTFSAQAASTGDSQAYQLGEQLSLGYGGSYYLNSIGQNEKWILGASGKWYCLFPDGELRRWMGDVADTMAPAALVTTLSPSVYQDPTQLWTPATTGNPHVTFTFTGNQLALGCDPSFLGSFTVTVSVSAGSATASQSFTVAVTQRAPVFSAIQNQSMAHSQKTLTVNLTVSNPDNDPLVLSARVLAPSQQAYNLSQTLGLTYSGSYWLNYFGQQEKWLLGTPIASSSANQWYCILPDGELRRAGTSAADMLAAGALVATFDSSFYQDPSLLWNAQPPVAAPATFAFTGNQLVVTPAASVIGTFNVQVTLTSGAINLTQTFHITVLDSAPVLASVPSQTMVHGKSLTVTLAASDPDGDLLSLAAQTVAPSQQAIDLAHNLGLTYTGSYYTNTFGQGEKWLEGGTTWYCLLPNGELRRAGTSAASMLASASLVATLDTGYFLDPSLLWNAANYVAPQVAYVFHGNQLTISTAANFAGSFVVEASVTDGALTARQAFQVTVSDSAPVLSALSTQTIAHSQGALTVTLAAADPDSDALTFSAQALSSSQVAFNLKQTLGLTYTGNYWSNYYGLQEKWLRDQSGQWYCLLPNGELRRAGGSAAAMLAASSLVATLDSSFYQDPSTLWNAQAGAAVPVTVTVTANEVTVTPVNGYTGTFYLEVSATDGWMATAKDYALTIS